MRQVKWGVLSSAAFAKSTAIPAMRMAEGVALTGIASRSREKAEAFAREFGFSKVYGSYEELLADPEIEAIYNPLPNGLHAEWTIKAAQAGKHCLVEKPFAANVAEAQKVAEAARQHETLVMEAFMWRFHPMHQRARQLIRDGAIGPVRFVRSAFTFTLARQPNVRLDPGLAGGGLMDVGCYCISAARFLFGQEPVRVYARAEYDPEYQVDMLACGLLEFAEGWATFDAGLALPYRCDYEVVGSRGRILAPYAFLPGDKAELEIESNGKTERESFYGVNQWSLEFEHFSHSIVEGTPLAYDIEDAIGQQKVIDAVYRSTRSGQPETL
jgi:predicted dehydrogenase